MILGADAARASWRVRDGGIWRDGGAQGRDARLTLDELDLSLTLDAVYAGLPLP
jgi:hypothetical protein